MNLDAAPTRSDPRGDYEEYHPYGSTAWWAGSSGLVSQKRYRFTGMERDDETGLQCHGVRYYAVWLGRWVSADPIGLGDGVSRFGYCHSAPPNRQDPTGLFDLVGEVVERAATGLNAAADIRDQYINDAKKGAAYLKQNGPMTALSETWMELSPAGQAIQALQQRSPAHALNAAKIATDEATHNLQQAVRVVTSPVELTYRAAQTWSGDMASAREGIVGSVGVFAAQVEVAAGLAPFAIAESKLLRIDVGGEGRYSNALNVNPNATTSATPSLPIPNRIPGTTQNIPLPSQAARQVIVENAPLYGVAPQEIARVVEPGGYVLLEHPTPYAIDAGAHQAVVEAVGGNVVTQEIGAEMSRTLVRAPPRRPR